MSFVNWNRDIEKIDKPTSLCVEKIYRMLFEHH